VHGVEDRAKRRQASMPHLVRLWRYEQVSELISLRTREVFASKVNGITGKRRGCWAFGRRSCAALMGLPFSSHRDGRGASLFLHRGNSSLGQTRKFTHRTDPNVTSPAACALRGSLQRTRAELARSHHVGLPDLANRPRPVPPCLVPRGHLKTVVTLPAGITSCGFFGTVRSSRTIGVFLGAIVLG
jgi:hypothetical protein